MRTIRIKTKNIFPRFSLQWGFLLLVILCLLPGKNSYGENEISVFTQVDRDKITIGDRIQYTVTIEHSPDVQIPSPREHLHLEAFELVKPLWGQEEKTKDGKLKTIDEYTISTFTTGDYVIPPYQVDYILPDGSETSITSASHAITVESVNPNIAAVEDVAPIRNPVDIAMSRKKVVLFAGLILIALALIIFILWEFFRKDKKEFEEPPLPPYDAARLALKRIKEEDLIEKQPPKVFALRISFILKNYLQGIFGFNATDLTTEEIREYIPDGMSLEIKQKIINVLDNSDLVKFAKAIPPKSDLNSDFETTSEIVEALRPRGIEDEEKNENPVEVEKS